MKNLLWLILGIVVILYFLPDNDITTSLSSLPSSPVSGSLAGNEKALAEINDYGVLLGESWCNL